MDWTTTSTIQYEFKDYRGRRVPIGEVVAWRNAWYSWLSEIFEALPSPTIEFIERHSGRDVYDVFEEMLADEHIEAVFGSRKAGLLSREWDILPASPGKDDVRIAAKIKELIDDIDNFEQSLERILNAIPFGFSASEIIWEIDNGVRVKRIKAKRPGRFYFDADGRIYLRSTNKPLPDKKFIVYIYNQLFEDSPEDYRGSPVLAKVYWLWFIKKHALEFWTIVAEKFAIPTVIGKYPPTLSAEGKRELLNALINLQQDSVARVPQGVDVDLIETNASEKGNFFRLLLNYCDAGISKAFLGQTLTTEITDRGTYAAARVHSEVREDIIVKDGMMLMSVMNSSLIWWLTYFNFGELPKYPIFYFDLSPDINIDDIKKAHDMGLKIGVNYLYKKLRIPPPMADEEVLPSPQELKQGLMLSKGGQDRNFFIIDFQDG